jgi:hypothetical protein
MEMHRYRVDPRMIPPVILSMGFGAFLIFLEGLSQRGILLILLLSPFFYLGAEILARKIVFDSEGMTVAKFLRSVRVEWSELNSLDAIRSGSKLFVILQGREARPVVITNTIAPFKDLVDRLLEFVPPDKVAPSARELLANPPSKHGPLLQAWITCMVITGLVVGKILGYD